MLCSAKDLEAGWWGMKDYFKRQDGVYHHCILSNLCICFSICFSIPVIQSVNRFKLGHVLLLEMFEF